MAKLDWGKKHICSECGTKFYDMNKPTPECPKCGSQIVISRKPRVGRPPLSKNKMAKVEVIKEKISLFLNEWKSHQKDFKSSFEIRYNTFIIVAAD